MDKNAINCMNNTKIFKDKALQTSFKYYSHDIKVIAILQNISFMFSNNTIFIVINVDYICH